MKPRKIEIAIKIAREVGLTKIEVNTVLNMFMDTIIELLREGKDVELRGFGNFKIVKRKSRIGRNPRTNTALQITGRYVVWFKPFPAMKRAVNDSFNE